MAINVDGPKTEAQWISEGVVRIRAKEKWLEKKHPFDLKFTYWDADELRFSMRRDRQEVFTIKRPDGLEILVTSRLDWTHPEKLTLRPDHLVELFLADGNFIDKILMVYRELGKFELQGLTAPGLLEMTSFCKGMDQEIKDVTHELRKEKIPKVFEKLVAEMEGGSEKSGRDRVLRRVNYYREVAYQFTMDRVTWEDEMRRLNLIR